MKTGIPRAFYSLRDQQPPLGVIVLVYWDGRGPFEAARVNNPQARAVRWAAKHAGETVLLPCRDRPIDPQKPWVGWHTLKGDEPELWAPKYPDKWELKLPAQACIVPAGEPIRMWTARQAFNATEAAAEMEADREAARAGGGEVAPQRRRLWWLDATKVRYHPPGQISKQEAEGRIMRALCADTFSGTSDGLGMHGIAAEAQLDDDQKRALAEAEASNPQEYLARFAPLPADGDDEDTAMKWFAALGVSMLDGRNMARSSGYGSHAGRYSRRQRVLYWASRDVGFSFADIGIAMRGPKISGMRRPKAMSRQAAHQLYRATIEQIWGIANGGADTGVIAQRAALEAIQKANRRAKQ